MKIIEEISDDNAPIRDAGTGDDSTEIPLADDPRHEKKERRRLSRVRQLVAPDSYVMTYAGIGSVLIGFVLIVIAWGRVAGLGNVALQVPYLVSAGFTGLALVMCGLVMVSIAAKRQDAAQRARQLAQLKELLQELQHTIAEEQGPR